MEHYEDLIKPNKIKNAPDYEATLETAWKVRDFEIGMFWQRTAYFSVLVGALFVAYYTIIGKEGNDYSAVYTLLISFLGFLASLVWWLSNKGSKFWQENWELHIDYIEKISKQNKIHSTILSKPEKKLFPLGAKAFSMSKLNMLFSFAVCISWLLMLLNNIMHFFPYKEELANLVSAATIDLILFILSILTLIIISICINKYCRSNLKPYKRGMIYKDGKVTFDVKPEPEKENTIYYKD